MNPPEKLNLWDRLFNRYRKSVISRGQEERCRYAFFNDGRGVVPGSEQPYTRHWIDYRIIDRLTGSETIKREYLS